MKIAVDIDDVLAATVPALNDFYNRKYGTNFKVSDYQHHDLVRVWGGFQANAVKAVSYFFDSQDFLRILPVPNAPESVSKLSKNNYFFAITSRPETIRNITEQFLQKHFPTIKKAIHTGQYILSASNINKADICLTEKADLMIEDCFETALDCARKGICTFWFTPKSKRPPLDPPENLIHVTSWPEILEKIGELDIK